APSTITFEKFAIISVIVCFACASAAIHAQQSPVSLTASLTLPILTFVPDSTGGLRPLLGIAGAASVGAALDLGFSIAAAVTSPGHDYILATAADIRRPLLLQLHDGRMTVRSFDAVA